MSLSPDESLLIKFQPLCVSVLRSPNNADSYNLLRSAIAQSNLKKPTESLFTFIYVPLRAVLLGICQSLSTKQGQLPSARVRLTEESRIALLDCLSTLLCTFRPPEDITPLIELFNLLCICTTSTSLPKSPKSDDSARATTTNITTIGLSDELLVSSFNCFNSLFTVLRSYHLPSDIISLTCSDTKPSLSHQSSSTFFSFSTLPLLAHFVTLALDALQQRGSSVQLRCSSLAALHSLVRLSCASLSTRHSVPNSAANSAANATAADSARDPADCLAAFLPGVCSAFSRVLLAAHPGAFHHSILVALLDVWRDLLDVVFADRHLCQTDISNVPGTL